MRPETRFRVTRSTKILCLADARIFSASHREFLCEVVEKVHVWLFSLIIKPKRDRTCVIGRLVRFMWGKVVYNLKVKGFR